MGRSQIKTWNVGGVRFQFPFGQTMPTQIIVGHWNPSKVKWLIETRYYGLTGCQLYQAGSAYHAPSRRPRMGGAMMWNACAQGLRPTRKNR
jgi:hypothetical protein